MRLRDDDFWALVAASREMVKAVQQMLDDWSESSDAVKQTLWRRVHAANPALAVALAAIVNDEGEVRT